MYAIHFRRSAGSKSDYAELASELLTLQEAKDARHVSGDLVVYQDTHEVVVSDEWLFDWELDMPRCYARQAQSLAVRPVMTVYDQWNNPVAEVFAD